MQTSAYPCIYFNTIVVIPTATIHIYKLNVHANPNIRLAKKHLLDVLIYFTFRLINNTNEQTRTSAVKRVRGSKKLFYPISLHTI